jgi:arylsulfatase A-like enzyme
VRSEASNPRSPALELLSAWEILLLAAWAGLVGGLAEAGIVAIKKYGFHQYVFRGLDFVWMTPVSLALICVATVSPIALLGRSRLGKGLASLPFVLLGLLILADLVPQLPGVHPLAEMLVLAGIAVRGGFWAARRAGRIAQLARRTVMPLAAFTLLLALGLHGVLRFQERGMFATLAPPAPGAPSVVLLILDTVGATDLSLYGYPRPTTSALDRMAAGGAVFDRAFATSSWTLESHASMFTGHRPAETGVGWRVPFDGRFPTLAEVFRSRGYATAGFVANLEYASRASGLARGFSHFEDFPVTPEAMLLSSAIGHRLSSLVVRKSLGLTHVPSRKDARRLREDIVGWLNRQDAARPVFVFANYWDAHSPYLRSAPFDTAFVGRSIPRNARNPYLENPRPVSREEGLVERTVYDQAIAAQDQELGRLFEALEQKDLLRNTLIIVTADHGEEFGEWGLLSHGNSLNPSALWVPLVMVFPGRIPEAQRLSEPVSLLNLAATILTLADPRKPAGLPGTPMLGRGTGAAPGSPAIIAELQKAVNLPAWYPVSHGPLRSVTLGGWHYIRDAEGGETLMDLSGNPAGRRADPGAPGMLPRLQRLRAVLDSASPPRR